jgi:hypothetical protein
MFLFVNFWARAGLGPQSSYLCFPCSWDYRSEPLYPALFFNGLINVHKVSRSGNCTQDNNITKEPICLKVPLCCLPGTVPTTAPGEPTPRASAAQVVYRHSYIWKVLLEVL